MGGGISRWKKQEIKEAKDEIEIVRRLPLTTVDEIMGSSEAKQRVLSALEIATPGVEDRWMKLLQLGYYI